MKIKSFQKYIETRLSKNEIAEIEQQVELEIQALQALRDAIAQAVNSYMKTEKIGFNELVRRLDVSPTHVAKIQKGEANLTLTSIARICALVKQTPQQMFKLSENTRSSSFTTRKS